MTHLEHGHGRDHAYVLAGESSPHVAPTTLDHGHGTQHAYVRGAIGSRQAPISHIAVKVPRDYHPEYPHTWGDEYHQYAKKNPHAAAIGQTQSHMKLWGRGYDTPLDDNEREASHSLRRMLNHAGHPRADEAFVVKHTRPEMMSSNVVWDREDPGVQGAALRHPDHWDYGTLAHEAAHIMVNHETGRMPGTPLSDEDNHGPTFAKHFRNLLGYVHPKLPESFDEGHGQALERIRGATGQQHTTATSHGPLYHGTSASDLTRVLPAVQHGRETFGGLSSPEHAYATGDLVQARQYADLSTMIHGGHPRVYEVRHSGPEHDLEPDPGYAPDVRSRHGFHVVRELASEELPASRFSTAVGSREAQTKRSSGPKSPRTASSILAIAFMPTKRLFGPTYGLDKRLFDGDRLKDDVRRYIYETLAEFWKGKHGVDWDEWAIIYLAGSEASEWTSEERIGNNDFDVLVGVDYDKFRGAHSRREAGKTDQEITDELNADFRILNQRTAQAYIEIDGKFEGPLSNTWYVNPDSYDIRKIKPYAAYDVTHMRWAVKPPHLPKWDISQFPEGPALVAECQAVSAYVRAILNMPEPYRTQQGYALWHHLHSDRARAFSPQGEGWFDPGNVLEKWLDQEGLWEQLVQIMVRVKADPSTMNAPTNWSNNPVLS